MHFFPPLHRTLRYAEWALIALTLFDLVTSGELEGASIKAVATGIFLTAFAGLSWIYPRNQPLWRRQGYVFLGIALALCASLIGVFLNPLLYLYLAKSCFLLNWRGVLFTFTITTALNLSMHFWILSNLFQMQQRLATSIVNQPQKLLWISVSNYLLSVTYVLGFVWIAISEQKSREKAEVLAQQVDTLAAHLERMRIARDIHDSLGHTLTTLDVHLAVARKWYSKDSNQALQALDTAKILADQCLEDVNRTLKTLRDSNFELNHALITLVEQIRQNSSLRVQWDIQLPDLPLQVRHHIYCIVKEGLINIQKHAQASYIQVQCLSTVEGICVKIEDNGRGFHIDTTKFGFGLEGMTERVQLLGGKLTIDSTVGKGTRIPIIVVQ